MKRLLLIGVHAPAVGGGIARSIHATAGKIDGPEAWVHLCLTAADEAYATVMESPPLNPAHEKNSALEVLQKWRPEEYPPDETSRLSGSALADAAHAAAAMAFRCCMPKLVGRRSTQSYIACVAAGVQRGYFSGSDGKALLYTAQLALAAYPTRKGKRK